MNQAKYIALYRVSTKQQQDSNLGLESQKQACYRYINAVGGEIVGEFVEVESGGVKDRVNSKSRNLSYEVMLSKRPVLKQVIELADKTGATIVVKESSRLTRYSILMGYLIEYRIKFVSADSPNDSPMIIKLKTLLNEDELEKVSTRTKASLAQKIRQGVKLGNNGYGMPSKIRLMGVQAIKNAAATNIRNRQAMELVVSANEKGLSLQKIAAKLNDLGYKTSRGKQFEKITVKRLLDRCM